MSEWREYLLKQICDIYDGPHATPSKLPSGQNIFLGISSLGYDGRIDPNYFEYVADEEFKKWTKRVKPQKNDIVFSYETKLGVAAIIPANLNCCLGRRMGLLRPKSNVDPRALLYAYLAPEFQKTIYERTYHGSTVDRIPLKEMGNFPINLPSLPEQKRIAEILSSLDDKIDLLHRQNKTLEALAETLFRQWFVEKAEETWPAGFLEDEFDFVMGQSPEGKFLNENREGEIFYQGRTDFGFRFPSPRVYTRLRTRMAKRLDTLISVRAPVGDMNMAFEDCCLGRGVAAFRYRKNASYNTYTYYKLRSLMEEIKQFEDKGSVFGSIGKDDFQKIDIVIPPESLIERFQATAKPIDDKIILNQNAINTLTKLRDGLLPKLMSGNMIV